VVKAPWHLNERPHKRVQRPERKRDKSKHRKTLAVVFTDPVSGTIEWSAVERLLIAAGAQVIEGRGSRVRFEKDGEVETFHRPHPAKEAKRYQVRAARAFLERIGVTP